MIARDLRFPDLACYKPFTALTEIELCSLRIHKHISSSLVLGTLELPELGWWYRKAGKRLRRDWEPSVFCFWVWGQHLPGDPFLSWQHPCRCYTPSESLLPTSWPNMVKRILGRPSKTTSKDCLHVPTHRTNSTGAFWSVKGPREEAKQPEKARAHQN